MKKKKRKEYTNSKRLVLPGKHIAGFLKTMDKRTELFSQLNEVYNKVLSDLGGLEVLSHMQIGLVERYVFVEAYVRKLEKQLGTSC